MGPDKKKGLSPIATKATKEQARDTGLALILIVLLVVHFGHRVQLVPLAMLLVVITMAWPSVWRPLAVLWFGLSRVLGAVSTRIVFSLLFFAVVMPVGLLRRALGADAMRLKGWKKTSATAFKERNHRFVPSDIEKMY
jgi:hypothetical protein